MLRNLLAILVVLIGTSVLFAQTGRGEIENWVEIRGLCAEADRELVEVSVGDAITEIIFAPDTDDTALAWYVGTTKTRRFWVSNQNSYVAVTAFVGGSGFPVDEYFVGNALQDCEQVPASETTPMNECLGIHFADFVNMVGFEPIETGFVVDGNFYNFHDTLSFLVPEDAIWAWDMYVDGLHVLSFEQTEDSDCAVIAIYPQGAGDGQ